MWSKGNPLLYLKLRLGNHDVEMLIHVGRTRIPLLPSQQPRFFLQGFFSIKILEIFVFLSNLNTVLESLAINLWHSEFCNKSVFKHDPKWLWVFHKVSQNFWFGLMSKAFLRFLKTSVTCFNLFHQLFSQVCLYEAFKWNLPHQRHYPSKYVIDFQEHAFTCLERTNWVYNCYKKIRPFLSQKTKAWGHTVALEAKKKIYFENFSE